MSIPKSILLACAALAVAFAAATGASATDTSISIELVSQNQAGNSDRGEVLYNSRCVACHSLDSNRVGPMHRGVFGRRAGGAEGYSYSPALRQSKIVWDAETLDRWLAGPQALIPGQRMNIKVVDPVDRADIIAYLQNAN